MIAVDLFAGAGGWDIAARRLGVDPLGIEWNHDACKTRRAAGMPTLEADITTIDPNDYADAEGLIASPPCQSFSAAGNRAGLNDPRGELVWTPLDWALAIRPRWIACEQVPAVEPIWRMIAHRLEEVGYRTAVGLLHSEQHGVPQTRTRAILLAHYDRPVSLPPPTHQRYLHGVPQGDPDACGYCSLFGDQLLPWVSMAEALGWDATGAIVRTGQRSGGSRDWADEFTRSTVEPAPTVGTMSPAQWVIDRSATTVTTDNRIGAPGHHDETKRTFSDGAIRLTVAEAAALQTFPPDHPWQGSKTAQHAQIGNAIPPLLAEAVLGQVIDR